MINNEDLKNDEVKNESEENKSTGKSGAFWQKATEFGKKAADGIQKGAKVIYDKTNEGIQAQKLKKYNPLMPKEYKSKNFNIPNVIKIVDEAGRRGVDVCEGAIGWREMVNDVEILYLYDEWIHSSGIKFVPVAKCDDVYCVDPFDRSRFIKADSIFGKSNEEKLAELEHIAYCLGAKYCSIEIAEDSCNVENYKVSVDAKTQNPSASVQNQLSSKATNTQSSKTISHFKGSDEPKIPNLKWFAYDDNIIGLISMRCNEKNSIKYKALELKSSVAATMSKKTAVAIDKLLKIKGSVSMEKQAVHEHNTKLIFEIEF